MAFFKSSKTNVNKGISGDKPSNKPKRRWFPASTKGTKKRDFDMTDADGAIGWKDINVNSSLSLAQNYNMLHERSHQLARENPHVKNFIRHAVMNVVSPKGFNFQSKLKAGGRSTGSLDKGFNADFEKLIKEAGKKRKKFTACGKMSETQADHFWFKNFIIDGEVIILKMPSEKNQYGYTRKFIDPQRLDHNLNSVLPNGNRIKLGVEVDLDDMPIAYHFIDYDPNDIYQRAVTGRRTIRIEAKHIIHSFAMEYIGQTRGITMLLPAGLRAHLINAFQKATVVSATVAMSKGHFYKLNHEAAEAAGVLGDYGEDSDDSEGNINEDQATLVQTIEPGHGEILPSYVEDIKTLDHDYPPANYKEFDSVNLHAMCAGLGAQYHAVTGDLEGVNYSSARIGEMLQRDIWRGFQVFMIEEWKEADLESFSEVLTFTSGLDAKKLRTCITGGHFRYGARGWDYVNPKDAAIANDMNLNNLLVSHRQIVEEIHGVQYEDYLEGISEDQDLMESHGLKRISKNAPPEPKPVEEPKNEEDE